MFNIMSHIANRTKYTRRYHPHHPLAQHIITQIESLALRPQDIVKQMGYPLKHTIPACDRLRHVLSHKYLGLDGSYMDKYFTAEAFLTRLFDVLEMPHQPFADDIAQIQYHVAHQSAAQLRYSVRADIDFIFTNGADWMSRGAASRFAEVSLPDDMATLDATERKSVIQDRICEHYQQYEDNLPYDGRINGYQLTVEQNQEVIERMEYRLPKSSNI